jgi:hypothetical protein
MEKQILELLTSMQKDIRDIKETTNNIKISETENDNAVLKADNKKIDFEIEYLHYRLTEMDKRIYALEKCAMLK